MSRSSAPAKIKRAAMIAKTAKDDELGKLPLGQVVKRHDCEQRREECGDIARDPLANADARIHRCGQGDTTQKHQGKRQGKYRYQETTHWTSVPLLLDVLDIPTPIPLGQIDRIAIRIATAGSRLSCNHIGHGGMASCGRIDLQPTYLHEAPTGRKASGRSTRSQVVGDVATEVGPKEPHECSPDLIIAIGHLLTGRRGATCVTADWFRQK